MKSDRLLQRAAFAAMMLIGGAALAEPALVSLPTNTNCAGETFKVWDRGMYVLYLRRACALPIDSAKNMHYGELRTPSPNVFYKGCWGTTLNGDIVMVQNDGKTSRDNPMTYVQADVRPDGSATITKESRTIIRGQCGR